jgi:uncharacterized protein
VTPVLLDTGCIVALLDRRERHHPQCVDVLADLTAPLVTCEAVVAEACYLLRALPGAADAVVENVQHGVFQVPFHLPSSAPTVRALMKKYRSVPMDFADACLVAMADELGTGRILTLDADFAIYRWRRGRAFDPLIELG